MKHLVLALVAFVTSLGMGSKIMAADCETLIKEINNQRNFLLRKEMVIRTPRGRDIFAACGQLKSESERMKKSARDRLESLRASELAAD